MKNTAQNTCISNPMRTPLIVEAQAGPLGCGQPTKVNSDSRVSLSPAKLRAWTRRLTVLALTLSGTTLLGQGNLIYQEGFNDDGSTNNPPRYTFTGQDIYEVDRIQAEIGNYDQKGPIYWNHNFNVSYTGNPAVPARRLIFGWRGVDTSTATEDLLKLFDSSVNWLLDGKKNATIVVNPNAAAI